MSRDRSADASRELPDGEELDDAVLDVFQTAVVGIESFARGNFARNVVVDAGGRGSSCNFGCQVDRNVIRGSGDDGIYIGIAGRVANNAVRENTGDGIAGTGEVLVRGNTITGSGGAGILNGVDLGANTCDGATCP